MMLPKIKKKIIYFAFTLSFLEEEDSFVIYFTVIILLHEKMDSTPDIKITSDTDNNDFTFENVEMSIYMFVEITITIIAIIIVLSIILQISNRITQQYIGIYALLQELHKVK